MNTLLKNTNKNLNRYLYIILPCFMFIFFDMIVYNHIGSIAQERHVNYDSWIILQWDKKIPFLPWFVFPYIFAWLYPVFSLLQILDKKGPDVQFFMRIYSLVFIIYACNYICWIAFPTHFNYGVATNVLQSGNWLDHLILWVYGKSSLFNSFPSFHIVMTVYVYLITKYITQDPYKLNAVIALSICLSTLFIRIHYILDVASGAFMGYLFYAYWRNWQQTTEQRKFTETLRFLVIK